MRTHSTHGRHAVAVAVEGRRLDDAVKGEKFVLPVVELQVLLEGSTRVSFGL
jgi:hypothetical protein